MSEQNFENIVFTKSENIGYITLNRPKSLNSLNESLTLELLSAFDLCEEDKQIKVVVLTGNGKGFSSGGDIKLMAELESKPESSPDFIEKLNEMIIKIRNLSKPVIAGINGFAAGAGLGLALACDFRVATKSAKFSFAFINIGLVPDSGTSYFLTKLLGYAKATELMMLGEPFDASEAFSLGLLNKVVDNDGLSNAVNDLAVSISSKSLDALSRIKVLTNRAIIADLADQLSLEAMFQSEAVKTDNFKEGITAFLEKRRPNFK